MKNTKEQVQAEQDMERKEDGKRQPRKDDHHLYQRPKKKTGIYWLKYERTFTDETGNKQKVLIQESLKTKNLNEAIKRRDDRLREYQIKDRNQFREEILDKIKTDSEKIEKIQAIKKRETNKISLADVWDKYSVSLDRERPKESTFKQYRFQWDGFYKHIKDIAPNRLYLDDITKEDAEKYLQTLTNLTPNTYNKIIRTLRGVFKVLWIDRPQNENPFYTFKSRTDIPTSHRELTLTELKDVCGKAEGELRVLLAIGAYTGLRLKDAALLQWQNISFAQDRITVIPAKTSRKNKIAKIPLHYDLKAILLETYTTDKTGYVLPEISANYLKDPTRVTNMIQAHFKTCGIETQQKTEGKKAICVAGYHSLRHSLVSTLANSGTAQALTMELVGHGSPQIHRIYTHGDQGALNKAVNSMPSLLLTAGVKPVIDVKADSDPSDLENRVKEAIALIQSGDIPAELKSKLISILGGKYA
ncbi:MAG: site-specific integrase [Victivallales bacterium]